MKITATLLFIITCIACYSQNIQFEDDHIEDPSIFEIGQTEPHATYVPFDDLNELSSDDHESGNFISLNGNWDFLWVDRPESVPADFHNPKYNTKRWDKIKVPSNWQSMGYGHPKFRNISLSFVSNYPNIPDDYNPTACYKRTFNVPSSWNGKDVLLRFEGIKSAAYIWVNGQEVGYNQGGFEPAEFDITKYLQKGTMNDISIKVIRFCDGSYLENQDMWRLSGIYRDVKLIALPKVNIHDFFYSTDLDDSYDNAELNIDVKLKNAQNNIAKNHSIEIDVINEKQQSILNEKIIKKGIEIDANGTLDLTLTSNVHSPKKWSAEYPNLYTIVFELKNQNNITTEVFSKAIGFKEVEMVGEVVKVNGVPVKLNGVNSHMHDPIHGQTVPLETLKRDLILMKQNNINCVRTCHYPPTPEYLDLADELGMYIVDEVSDEAHSNIELSYNQSYTEMYKDRCRKLIHRDRNHASVIFWSAGNESGSGPNIHEVIKTGLELDPTRTAWMYGGNTFYIPFEPVTGPRYWTPQLLKNLAERKFLGEDDLRPAFMDEYLAATGNGLGGLDEYWELIWEYPRLLGGAIWDWISPGMETKLWTVSDQSSCKNDGSIMGRPLLKKSDSGAVISLSGHDDWIEFYRSQSLNIMTNEITMSFDVNPKEIPQQNTFLTKGKHGYGIVMSNSKTLEFYIQSNNLNTTREVQYYTNKTERISAKATVGDDWYNNWHNVVGMYNGECMSLYIDGKEVAKTQCSGEIAHTPFPLCIGRDAEVNDQGEHSGRLSCMEFDNLIIYNKAVELNEIENRKDESVLNIDFETTEIGDTYYAVGLGGRAYGIVWPDRTVQPEIHQIKKSGQPIAVELIDLDHKKFKIINRHHFKNLNDFEMNWSVMVDGAEVESGQSTLNIDAQSSEMIDIPFHPIDGNGEVILNIEFKLKDKTQWANKGDEIAFEQFIIQEKRSSETTSKGNVNYEEDNEQIIIRGDHFKYVVDKKTGMLDELNFKKKNYIENGPLFSIWRAPISNDVDPWGAYLFSQKNVLAGQGRSIDNQYRTLGMRDLQIQIDKISAYQKSDELVLISVVRYGISSNARGQFQCIENYAISGDGTISIELSTNPEGEMPEIIQRLGWQFEIPKEYTSIQWYGRGPFETYPDRKTGAKIGIFSSTIEAEYVPYIFPQEHGNHTDTRWLKIENDDHKGLLISSDELLNFSYREYTTDNLSRAVYTHQLQKYKNNILNIDFEQAGVGGTAIRVLQKYKVHPASKTYRFTIQPYE